MSRALIGSKELVRSDGTAGQVSQFNPAITVGVNAEFLANGRPDGIPHASFGLLREMAELDRSISWLLFTPAIEWPQAGDALRALPNCRLIVTGSTGGRLGRVAWRLLALPWLARRHRVGALFNPVGNGPAWMPPGIPLIITVHDVSWLGGRNWYGWGYRLGQRLLTGRALAIAKEVFAVSSHTAAELINGLGIPASRVTVVPNGVRQMHPMRRTPAMPDKPTALFVGTLIRRKNLTAVWRAFCRIRQQDDLDVQLIVVGAFRDPKAVTAEAKADPNVRFLGFVDDQALADLYSTASFLAVPSFDEGFCLPITEAMALGTPVITSRNSALSEVAGDAALLVDPNSDDEIYLAMRRLFIEPGLRKELRERGYRRAALFSWKESARIGLTALKSTVGVKSMAR
jgi:glycosyltransferase involved in cell wall biosynthesis